MNEVFVVADWLRNFGSKLKGDQKTYWESNFTKRVNLPVTSIETMEKWADPKNIGDLSLMNTKTAQEIRDFLAAEDAPWESPTEFLGVLDDIIENGAQGTLELLAREQIARANWMMDNVEIAQDLYEAVDSYPKEVDFRPELAARITQNLTNGTLPLEQRYIRAAMLMLFGDQAETYAKLIFGIEARSSMDSPRNKKVVDYLVAAGRRFAALGRINPAAGNAVGYLVADLAVGLQGVLKDPAFLNIVNTVEDETRVPEKVPIPIPSAPRVPVVAGASIGAPATEQVALTTVIGLANAVYVLVHGIDRKEDIRTAFASALLIVNPGPRTRTDLDIALFETMRKISPETVSRYVKMVSDPTTDAALGQDGAPNSTSVSTNSEIVAAGIEQLINWGLNVPFVASMGLAILSILIAKKTPLGFSTATLLFGSVFLSFGSLIVANMVSGPGGRLLTGLDDGLPWVTSVMGALAFPILQGLSTLSILALLTGFLNDKFALVLASGSAVLPSLTIGTTIAQQLVVRTASRVETNRLKKYAIGAIYAASELSSRFVFGTTPTEVALKGVEAAGDVYGSVIVGAGLFGLLGVLETVRGRAIATEPENAAERDRARFIIRFSAVVGTIKFFLQFCQTDFVGDIVNGTLYKGPLPEERNAFSNVLRGMDPQQVLRQIYESSGIIQPLVTDNLGIKIASVAGGVALAGIIAYNLRDSAPSVFALIDQKLADAVANVNNLLSRAVDGMERFLLEYDQVEGPELRREIGVVTYPDGSVARLHSVPPEAQARNMELRMQERILAAISSQGRSDVAGAAITIHSLTYRRGESPFDEDFSDYDDPDEYDTEDDLTDEFDTNATQAFFSNLAPIKSEPRASRTRRNKVSGWLVYKQWSVVHFVQNFGVALMDVDSRIKKPPIKFPGAQGKSVFGACTPLAESRHVPARAYYGTE